MILDFDNVSFSYNRRTKALDDVNASFGPGVHLLLGPNGAGKSTLLRVGAGLLDPSEGACKIDGEVMACHDPHAVKHVFLLSDDMRFPLPTLSDMVKLHAPFYPSFSAETLERNLESFGLNADMRLEDLSPGNRRKANAAYALALGTEIIMLDEPANGLDMAAKETLTSLLISAADEGERCIFVATHTVQEMRNIFDSVTILYRGRIALSASTAELAGTLAFISDPLRRPDALYFRDSVDGPNQIVPANSHLQTAVDFRLLYSAVTECPDFRYPRPVTPTAPES